MVEPSVATEWYEELLKLDTCKSFEKGVHEFILTGYSIGYRPTLKVYGRDVRQNRSIAGMTLIPTPAVLHI